MFKWFKKLAQPHSFMPPEAAIANTPAQTKAAPAIEATPEMASPAKPSLKQRVLEGLPGFIGGAGSVMAAKSAAAACAKGLCVSSSPLALAAAGVLGAAAVGGVAAQTVSHIKDRWALAEAEGGKKLGVRDLVRDFSLAAAKRELGAYGHELAGKKFWKGAATKGGISAVCGAAFGGLMSTETAQQGLQKGLDYVSQIKPLSVLEKIVTTLSGSGSAHAGTLPTADARLPVSSLVAAEALAPSTLPTAEVRLPVSSLVAAEALAPSTLPITTPIDQLKTLAEAKGTPNSALTKLLARASAGNLQAIKDAAMGAWNGKLGLPVNKDLARQLYEIAAKGGNAQAVRDLAWINATHPAAAPTLPTSAPVSASLPVQPAPPLALADGIPAAGSIDEMAPVILPPPIKPIEAPTRLGSEAGRCVLEQLEKGKSTIRSLCSVFKSMVMPNEQVLMQSADGSLNQPYLHEGTEPKATATFLDQSRRDFRDTLFLPSIQR